jgi:hypothetical protein
MDMDTTGAENTLPEQETPREPSWPPPITMISTINLSRIQSNFKYHIKGEFQNTRTGTRIMTKEVGDYSAIKSYLEKNKLHYFTFSSYSTKHTKAAICHLLPDMPVEDISNSLKDLGLNNPSLYSLLP